MAFDKCVVTSSYVCHRGPPLSSRRDRCIETHNLDGAHSPVTELRTGRRLPEPGLEATAAQERSWC